MFFSIHAFVFNWCYSVIGNGTFILSNANYPLPCLSDQEAAPSTQWRDGRDDPGVLQGAASLRHSRQCHPIGYPQ